MSLLDPALNLARDFVNCTKKRWTYQFSGYIIFYGLQLIQKCNFFSHSFFEGIIMLRGILVGTIVVVLLGLWSAAPAAMLNEVRLDRTGAGNDDFIELYGSSGEDISALTYVVLANKTVGGDGVIDLAISLSGHSIPSDGYFVIANSTFSPDICIPVPTPEISIPGLDIIGINNMSTHLLVQGFTGAVGNDLDTNDDGTLDVTPWTSIVDDVAFYSTGHSHLIYSSTVLLFDGDALYPHRGYRFPDGASWTRNPGDWDQTDLDTPGLPNANQSYGTSIFSFSDPNPIEITETTSTGFGITTFGVNRLDCDEGYSFILTDDAGGRFNIDTSGWLTVGNSSLLDYETATTHSIEIQATGDEGTVLTQTFVVDVLNLDEPPTDINLSASTVAENSAANTPVGALSTTDPDVNSTAFTYTMINSAGGRFKIGGVGSDEVWVDNGALLNFEVNPSHTIRVRSTDNQNQWFEKDFIITITDVNDAPSDIALTPSSLAENSPVGTTVGTLSSTDDDPSETFVYTLLDDAGGRFSLGGGGTTIVSNQIFDFETPPTSFNVTVQTRDQGGTGLTHSEVFSINITNVNEAPTDIALGNNSVAENVSSGAVVGGLSSTDPDAGESFVYSLLDDAGGRFAISGANLVTAQVFDFETPPTSFNVTVQTRDQGGTGLTHSEVFSINITNVNEAPTDIALGNNSVAENAAAGATVGGLSSTDPDAGETFVYSLLDDAGGRFAISGANLVTAQVFDFETPPTSFNVTVQTRDQGGTGLTHSEIFSINITNVNEAPTDIALGNNSVAENASSGATVGGLSSTDPDAGESFVYSLLDDAGGRFAISGTNLVTAQVFDFETPPTSFNVTVQTRDQGGTGLTHSEVFAISITNVNEAPVAICQNIQANADGSCQAAVTPAEVNNGSYDPDAGDNVTLIELDPPGPYPIGITNVTLRIQDSFGLISTCTAQIEVLDVDAPTVTCPANISVVTNDPTGVIVNFAASATDVCDANPALEYAPLGPGNKFPVGVTTVTVTARDAGDNTDTCQFDVEVLLDQDGDGILDSDEDLASGGDGNGDSIPDRLQGNVVSIPNAVDGRIVTFAAPAGATISNGEASLPAGGLPPAVTLPLGVFSFQINGLANGASAIVEMYPPVGETIDTYYKFGPESGQPADHWFEFLHDGVTGLQTGGPVLLIHFKDGDRGDFDLAANGVIVDPGGPVTLVPPTSVDDWLSHE